MDKDILKGIPEYMLDEPANLTWRGLADLIEIIWARDNASYDRLRALETKVFGDE